MNPWDNFDTCMSHVRDIILQQRALEARKKSLLGARYNTRSDDELLSMYEFVSGNVPPAVPVSTKPVISPVVQTSSSSAGVTKDTGLVHRVSRDTSIENGTVLYCGMFSRDPPNVSDQTLRIIAKKFRLLERDLMSSARDHNLQYTKHFADTVETYCRQTTVRIVKANKMLGMVAIHVPFRPTCWCSDVWCTLIPKTLRKMIEFANALIRVYMANYPNAPKVSIPTLEGPSPVVEVSGNKREHLTEDEEADEQDDE